MDLERTLDLPMVAPGSIPKPWSNIWGDNRAWSVSSNCLAGARSPVPTMCGAGAGWEVGEGARSRTDARKADGQCVGVRLGEEKLVDGICENPLAE